MFSFVITYYILSRPTCGHISCYTELFNVCSSEATAYTNRGCLEDFIRHHVCSPVLHWGVKLPSRINKVLYYLTPRCVMCDLVSDLKVFFLFPQGFLLQGCERQGDANLWRQRLGVQWMSSKTLLNRTQTVGTQHMVGGQVCSCQVSCRPIWLVAFRSDVLL